MSAREQALHGPEIEVAAKATRRRFTVEYKRKIVREANGCKTPGAVGALLRREGLYSSHLTTWRAARERGELAGPKPKKRGPATGVVDARDKRIAALERETTRWRTRAERAEALIEVQKTSRRCWERRWTPSSPDADGRRGRPPTRYCADVPSARVAARDVLSPTAAPECPAATPSRVSRPQYGRARGGPRRLARAALRGSRAGRGLRHAAR